MHRGTVTHFPLRWPRLATPAQPSAATASTPPTPGDFWSNRPQVHAHRTYSAIIFIAICCGLLSGCTTPNPYFSAAKPHHRANGFQNNYAEFEPKNFFTDVLLGWQLPSRMRGLPLPPSAPPPTVTPDAAWAWTSC